MRTHSWALGGLLACALGAGCPPPDNTADGGTDAGPPGVSYTFKLLRIASYDPTPTTVAAVGATIAFTRPDGSIVEATSDDQGRATIDGVDWSGGGRAATCAFAPQHQVVCAAAFQQSDIDARKQPDGTIEITLLPLQDPAPPSTVTVSGTALHMEAPGHSLTVTSPQTAGWHQSRGEKWALVVPTNTPLTLVALEWVNYGSPGGASQTFLHWAVVEHEAVAADHEITIDFDTAAATPTRISGTIPLPASEPGTFFGDASAYLTIGDAANIDVNRSRMNSLFLGGVTSLLRRSDGSAFDFAGEYVTLPGITPSVEFQLWRTGSGGRMADWGNYWRIGAPSSGTLDLDLVGPPTIVAPPAFTPMLIEDELVWQADARAAAHPAAQQHIWLARTGQIIWHVMVPGDVTRLVLPALPSNVDRATVLGSDLLSGYLQMNELDAAGQNLLWQAQAPTFSVQP